MFRRLFLGLFEGVSIGAGLAAASARLGLGAPGSVLLALLAGVAGFLVGLVAGRPIWARNAKTEALLKGGAGALVGAVGSVALGHWLTLPVNLAAYTLGAGPAGSLAAVVLPAVACTLGLFFELDDTGGAPRTPQVGAGDGKQRLAEKSPEQGELAELAELEAQDEEASRKPEKR